MPKTPEGSRLSHSEQTAYSHSRLSRRRSFGLARDVIITGIGLAAFGSSAKDIVFNLPEEQKQRKERIDHEVDVVVPPTDATQRYPTNEKIVLAYTQQALQAARENNIQDFPNHVDQPVVHQAVVEYGEKQEWDVRRNDARKELERTEPNPTHNVPRIIFDLGGASGGGVLGWEFSGKLVKRFGNFIKRGKDNQSTTASESKISTVVSYVDPERARFEAFRLPGVVRGSTYETEASFREQDGPREEVDKSQLGK